MSDHPRTLAPHGGYPRLKSFRGREIIYDGTVGILQRLIDSVLVPHDQCTGRAQRAAEHRRGSRASATSSKSELTLVNVRGPAWMNFCSTTGFPPAARASAMGKRRPTSARSSAVGRQDADAEAYAPWLKHAEPGVVANTLICLITRRNYLLDRQIAALERLLIQEGGYSEQLHAARLAERQRQLTDQTIGSNQSDRSDPQQCRLP